LTRYEPPTMPFVSAKLQGGKQKPTAILLRPSHTNSFEGAALAVAQNWHKSQAFWDAGHYSVDCTRRYRCVSDKVVAGAGPNVDKNAIRIAVCAEPYSGLRFWSENHHRLVLRKTAELVAELTLAYKIRPILLNSDEFESWKNSRTRRRGGIYVFEESGWPSESFIDEVNAKRDLKKHI
jgi:hypothetical protein